MLKVNSYNLGILSLMVPLLSSFRFGSGEGFFSRLLQLESSCSSMAVTIKIVQEDLVVVLCLTV